MHKRGKPAKRRIKGRKGCRPSEEIRGEDDQIAMDAGLLHDVSCVQCGEDKLFTAEKFLVVQGFRPFEDSGSVLGIMRIAMGLVDRSHGACRIDNRCAESSGL